MYNIDNNDKGETKNMNTILEQFYSGNLLNPKESLASEIERFEEIIEEWGDVYSGDQGYQNDLMTLGALQKAMEEMDDYYDENGVYVYEELFSKIKEIAEEYTGEYTSISYSDQKLKASEVKDTFGKPIFPNDDRVGTLIFVDPITNANWSHYCDYYFYTEDKELLHSAESWSPFAEIFLCKYI